LIQQFEKLTAIEQTTVLALNAERNRRLQAVQEVDTAVSAQIVAIAERQKLPPDQYILFGGNDGTIYLARDVPEEVKAEEEPRAV
jgi:hypothetical protein